MKYLIIILVTLGIVITISVLMSSWSAEYTFRPHPREKEKKVDENPTPAQLARQAEVEDSLLRVAKVRARQEMTEVVKGYKSNFKDNNHTGYFMTDLDSDDLPELWVVIGTLGENFRLELFYPMADGSLKRSYQFSGFGTYYKGDTYLMQAAKSGTYVDINKITIRKGELYSDTHHSIDLTTETAKLPQMKEKELQLINFSNLSPLNAAFTEE